MHFLRETIGQVRHGSSLSYLILMLAVIVGPRLAERVRLPAMVGLVLAGMAVGPHGAHVLHPERIALSAWGDFGLLYLMFSAGLDLDFKLLVRMRSEAFIFAVLSFAIPFTVGIVSARWLGYALVAAVLMGSNWGSHTLVTYPLLRQMGLAKNRAVATVVGATVVTDTSALLVLSAVSASVRQAGGFGFQALEILAGLTVLVLWTLLGLPKVCHWFFSSVGSDRSYRFVFGMAAFLSGAVLAETASIDGLVGAFFAGLGLSRAIPEKSPLMDRVQFFGSSLFIPIFLVSVGVLLDPRVMIDPRTLLVALVFTIAVLGGKALAAVIAGRSFRFGWPEIGVMSGLSGSQAAATLAITLVGARLGIFDTRTINAVLVVILASLVVTPALVSFFGKKVAPTSDATEALGAVVLVPIQGEFTQQLLSVAGRLAAADGGIVVPAGISGEDVSEAELAARRRWTKEADERLEHEGFESRSVFRVSTSMAAGLLQAVREEGATLLVTGSLAQPLSHDIEAFEDAALSPVPILAAHGAIEPFERIVVVAREKDLAGPRRRDQDLAIELSLRLAQRRPVVCVDTGGPAFESLIPPKSRVVRIANPDPLAWVDENVRETDLLVFAGMNALRDALRCVPRLAGRRFVTAIAAHGDRDRPHHGYGASPPTWDLPESPPP